MSFSCLSLYVILIPLTATAFALAEVPSLSPTPSAVAIDNVFNPAIECIESTRDDEPLLTSLHIIVSVPCRGNVRFEAGVSEMECR